MSALPQNFWPSARHYAEAMQFPSFCFSIPELRNSQPAVDRLGMPLVTSGQFAYVYKLKTNTGAFAVRCFRGFLGDREARYKSIDEHLEKHRIHALASFDYDAEGILVGGKRFPILVMEWVDGPTLDVYLREVYEKRDVVKHIAEQWVSLISDLQEAKICHGDLQHGNIIVERGRLRLVDLDGIYVPTMKGWEASEVGHQHYQHPKRDEKFFNSYLDNFSALVIYLSLISIAEKPSLWKKYHDENLLFIKNDFLAPEKSPLFREIKEISEEHRRLAEVLEASAKDSPYLTPSLLNLVEVKTESNLPLWMTAPPEVDVAAKTREDKTVVIPRPQQKGTPTWTPWQMGDTSLAQGGITSNSVQTIFGSGIAKPTDPNAIFSNAFFYANEIVSKKIDFAVVAFATVIWFGSMCFSPWAFFVVPLMASGLLMVAGFVKSYENYNSAQLTQSSSQLIQTPNQGLTQIQKSFRELFMEHFIELISQKIVVIPVAIFFSLLLTIIAIGSIETIVGFALFIPLVITIGFFVLIGCLQASYQKAKVEFERQTYILNNPQANQTLATSQTGLLSSHQTPTLPSVTSFLQTQSMVKQTFIGNVMFGIYHKEDCEWVKKIPPGRRAKFNSLDEAEDKNYNPCHVCFPQDGQPKETKTIPKPTDADKSKQSVSSSTQTQTLQITQPPPQPKPVVKFVGNRLLGIYHKPECEWAKKIPQGKLIKLYSEDEAKKENYRRCHVCAP